MNREEMDREGMDREQQLRREIDLITAVTADFEAAARDLLIGSDLSPSNARARDKVIALLGVNYVGPESLGKLLYGDEDKFQEVELDYVKLKEILNEPDEWEPAKNKFETYALVYRPPISFLELRARANVVAMSGYQTPAFSVADWFRAEAFAKEAPSSGSWELIRLETVPGTTSKNFVEQKEMIFDKPNLTPASFAALAALLVGQFLGHDIQLYNGEWRYGRTSTCAASGGPVSLGYMDSDGAYVASLGNTGGVAGLAVSRNLN